jgi:hypothetical protein
VEGGVKVAGNYMQQDSGCPQFPVGETLLFLSLGKKYEQEESWHVAGLSRLDNGKLDDNS